MRFHIHYAVIAGKVAKASRFQYPVNLVEHPRSVRHMFVYMRADHHVDTVIDLLQVHGITNGKIKIGLVKCLPGIVDSRLINVDAGNALAFTR